MNSMQPLAQKIYEQAQAAQAAQGGATGPQPGPQPTQGSNPDDGVIDGDFKEI